MVMSKESINNIGLIISVISHNLFEEISKNTGLGSIEAHSKILELAIAFEEKYRKVQNWENFLAIVNLSRADDEKFWDWEEFIIAHVKMKLSIS